jgi:hypothetical protein
MQKHPFNLAMYHHHYLSDCTKKQAKIDVDMPKTIDYKFLLKDYTILFFPEFRSNNSFYVLDVHITPMRLQGNYACCLKIS